MNSESQNNLVVLASRNQGKITEIHQVLKSMLPDITVCGLDDWPEIGDIPETGSTFEENALIKARTVSQAIGHLALADDSGLSVPALGGEPGVYSARYAGPGATDQENNAKLLQAMENLADHDRRAFFVCVMAAISPEGQELVVREAWHGTIARQPEGKSGFGYDPLFLDPEVGLHSAQMSAEMKNSRSHRGKALKKLAEKWQDFMHRVRTSRKQL
ncbi:MAG: RdgB/HAM1 family non-canonical purine NTP pyrophosphatase [Desulfonatronovibrionaceae bacterium]